jgi:hypothetical protein
VYDGIEVFWWLWTQLINNTNISKMLIFSFIMYYPLHVLVITDHHHVVFHEYTWSSYKITGLIFLPTRCGLGNREQHSILACPLLFINPTTSKAVRPTKHGMALAKLSKTQKF